MKLKFKKQAYQTRAVDAVVDCFKGQPNTSGISYRMDPGKAKQSQMFEAGFKNQDIILGEQQVLENMQEIQRLQNLPQSSSLVKTKAECARKFFGEINRKINPDNVKYDVVDSFGKLMDLVNS